jgi:hypothetical protein
MMGAQRAAGRVAESLAAGQLGQIRLQVGVVRVLHVAREDLAGRRRLVVIVLAGFLPVPLNRSKTRAESAFCGAQI